MSAHPLSRDKIKKKREGGRENDTDLIGKVAKEADSTPCMAYRAFSHDVTAAILVFQNNKAAAMLAYQTNPVGFELFFYVNTFFCSIEFA